MGLEFILSNVECVFPSRNIMACNDAIFLYTEIEDLSTCVTEGGELFGKRSFYVTDADEDGPFLGISDYVFFIGADSKICRLESDGSIRAFKLEQLLSDAKTDDLVPKWVSEEVYDIGSDGTHLYIESSTGEVIITDMGVNVLGYLEDKGYGFMVSSAGGMFIEGDEDVWDRYVGGKYHSTVRIAENDRCKPITEIMEGYQRPGDKSKDESEDDSDDKPDDLDELISESCVVPKISSEGFTSYHVTDSKNLYSLTSNGDIWQCTPEGGKLLFESGVRIDTVSHSTDNGDIGVLVSDGNIIAFRDGNMIGHSRSGIDQQIISDIALDDKFLYILTTDKVHRYLIMP